jgi:hypothetical protein
MNLTTKKGILQVDEAQPGARSDDESFASVRLGATPRLAAKRSAAQRTSHTLHLRRSLSSSQSSSTTRGPRETGATIAGAVGWNLPCPSFLCFHPSCFLDSSSERFRRVMARVAHRGPLVTTQQLTSVRMVCHRRQRQDDSKFASTQAVSRCIRTRRRGQATLRLLGRD